MPRFVPVVLFALTTAACGGGSPASPAPDPTPLTGITFDNIQVAHQFIVGSPVPTQNQTSTYCCWPLPIRNAGSYIFNLANFPANVTPSGGSSNVISESEMVLVGVNVTPSAGTIRFEWHKAVHQDTVVFTFTTSPTASWGYAYIGHFSHEISEPGPYYVLVDTAWGRARLDFLVTGQSTSSGPSIRTSGGGGGSGAAVMADASKTSAKRVITRSSTSAIDSERPVAFSSDVTP